MTSSHRESLAALDPEEAWGRLESATVGVAAFVHDGHQHQLPVNYTLIDRVLYLRTAADSVLSALAAGHDDVAFTVLYRASGFTQGWNVTLRGRTEEVDDPRARDAIIEASGLEPWAGGERDVLIALHAAQIDGRQAALHHR